MKAKILNIQEFSNYINIDGLKSEDLHIVNFEGKENVRAKSEPVNIDFYLLAIKPHLNDATKTNSPLMENISDSAYMYVDCPQNTLEWDITPPMAGYAIMVSSKYLDKYAKDYSFAHYNNHEALFLNLILMKYVFVSLFCMILFSSILTVNASVPHSNELCLREVVFRRLVYFVAQVLFQN